MTARRRRLLVGLAVAAITPVRHALAAAGPRVVTIGGAVTEIVHALSATDLLVGTDSTSTFPTSLARLPRVGYMRQLSAEGVLSLRPDLVLATAEAGPPAVLAQIESAGVRLHRLPVRHSIEALRDNIISVAQVLQRAPDGVRLAGDLDARWRRTVAGVPPSRPGPRVLFVMAHGGGAVMAGGQDTAADAMLRYAGAVNAAGDMTGYRPLTAEAAIAAAPEVILLTTQGIEQTGGARAILSRPGLALTAAGRAGRVVAMEALYLLGFGPRLPEAVSELSQRLRTA